MIFFDYDLPHLNLGSDLNHTQERERGPRISIQTKEGEPIGIEELKRMNIEELADNCEIQIIGRKAEIEKNPPNHRGTIFHFEAFCKESVKYDGDRYPLSSSAYNYLLAVCLAVRAAVVGD